MNHWCTWHNESLLLNHFKLCFRRLYEVSHYINYYSLQTSFVHLMMWFTFDSIHDSFDLKTWIRRVKLGSLDHVNWKTSTDSKYCIIPRIHGIVCVWWHESLGSHVMWLTLFCFKKINHFGALDEMNHWYTQWKQSFVQLKKEKSFYKTSKWIILIKWITDVHNEVNHFGWLEVNHFKLCFGRLYEVTHYSSLQTLSFFTTNFLLRDKMKWITLTAVLPDFMKWLILVDIKWMHLNFVLLHIIKWITLDCSVTR